MNQPPPQDSLWRCSRHPNFRLRTGCPWTAARRVGDEVRVDTPDGERTFDFLIFATGIVTDLASRPELSGIVSDIALWRDRYTPPTGEEDEGFARAPYLGRGFEFIEKHPGRAPHLRRIRAFNYGATTSQGLAAASISGMKYGIRRLIDAVTRDLFVENAGWHLAELSRYADREITFYRPDLPIEAWEARTAAFSAGAT